jgi:hypothetical protein
MMISFCMLYKLNLFPVAWKDPGFPYTVAGDHCLDLTRPSFPYGNGKAKFLENCLHVQFFLSRPQRFG